MKELLFELIYDKIDFKTMMILRILNTTVKKIYDRTKFWYIVNMTDVNIRDTMELIQCFDDEYFYSFNLSGKDIPVFKVPRSLMIKLSYIRLLVF